MNGNNQHLTLDEAKKGLYILGNTRFWFSEGLSPIDNFFLNLHSITYSHLPHPLDTLEQLGQQEVLDA